MRKEVWQYVLRDSMVGPIVLAQFAFAAISPLMHALAEPLQGMVARLANWLVMRARIDASPPFVVSPFWSPIAFADCMQALIMTGVLYLLAVWLYEEQHIATGPDS